MTVFNRIKHSEAAANAGVPLRDTELIIFGNPKIGSQLISCQQTVAIDLPLKALTWKDEAGTVRMSYNDPEWNTWKKDIRSLDVQQSSPKSARLLPPSPHQLPDWIEPGPDAGHSALLLPGKFS